MQKHMLDTYYIEKVLPEYPDIVCFEILSNQDVLLIPGNDQLFIWNLDRHTLQHYKFLQYTEKLHVAGERLFGIRFCNKCRIMCNRQWIKDCMEKLVDAFDFTMRTRFIYTNLKYIFYMEEVHPVLRKTVAEIERLQGTGVIENLAEAYGYSKRQLERIFKQYFGYGPKRYSQYVKLLHAISKMQEKPETSIIEFAGEAGYADIPHFQRQFKQYIGIPPRQFRKRYMGNFLR